MVVPSPPLSQPRGSTCSALGTCRFWHMEVLGGTLPLSSLLNLPICTALGGLAFFVVSTKRTVSAAIAGATEGTVRGANSNTHRPPQKKAGGL